MKKQITFEDSPVIIVVGGGPAGAFFTIQMLKKARDLGKSVAITIIEKKKGVTVTTSFPFNELQNRM